MEPTLRRIGYLLGRVPFVRDAVALYFCLIDPQTPPWAKATIATTLAYFLSPFDAIPDMVAGLGFTDDAGMIAGTIATVASSLTDDHRRQADAFLLSLGESPTPTDSIDPSSH